MSITDSEEHENWRWFGKEIEKMRKVVHVAVPEVRHREKSRKVGHGSFTGDFERDLITGEGEDVKSHPHGVYCRAKR